RIAGVRRRVPLEADLRRMGAEELLADLRPQVPGVGGVLEEQPQRSLEAPYRRQCRRPGTAAHLGGELLDVLRASGPGIVVGEALEAPDVGVSVMARRGVEVARQVLIAAGGQQGLEPLILRGK